MNGVELDILIPPFLAGLLVLATHVPLGMKILDRGVIFADLAIAQIAGLGIIIAGLLNLTDRPILVQIVAAFAALSGAALLTLIENRLPEVKEACIGIIFVLAASGGILLMSHDVHAGEHLQNLLAGQILWTGYAQLATIAALSAAILLAWHFLRQSHFGFYALFALAVTASVQLIGVYLVFASLIVPALSTCRIEKHRMIYACTVGVTGYVTGLLLSALFDLPSGAAIVWAMALSGGITALFSRRTAT